jgi:hypothetical protein
VDICGRRWERVGTEGCGTDPGVGGMAGALTWLVLTARLDLAPRARR